MGSDSTAKRRAINSSAASVKGLGDFAAMQERTERELDIFIKYMSVYAYLSIRNMKTHDFIRALAGSFVLLGTVLAWAVSPWWLLLTGFVGANLLQSAFTGFCVPTLLLEKLGWIDETGTIHWGGRSHVTKVAR